MAGLAAGAYWISRLAHLVRRPILAYGVLEAGVAISALLVPLALDAARLLQTMTIGGQDLPPSGGGLEHAFFYTCVAFVVLMLPTACMGATLPLLARYVVTRDSQVGPRVGWLYAVNTGGAVAGAVLAGFWLVPKLGLLGTILVGAAANLVVFLLAVAIERASGLPDFEAAKPAARRTRRDRRARWTLFVICVSGANSFFLEVQWTRLLNHTFGGTLTAFSTMLATFLAGIAIGGAIGGRAARNRDRASLTMVFVLIAVSSLVTYQFLDQLAPGDQSLAGNVLFACAAMLPSTILIGVTFPIAVRLVAQDEKETMHATASAYAWNTLGAIVGSLSAGFLLIPALGFSLSAKLAGLVSLSLAVVCALAIDRKPGIAAVTGALLVWVAVFHDAPRPVQLLQALAGDREKQGAEIFYGVGKSATILVRDVDGAYQMRSNGLPESTIYRRGAPPSKHSQYWLTALPAIARPEASDLLMIGMGGGVALEAVPPHIHSIDVVELEDEVIEANRRLSALRNVDPLSDPRLRLVVNDARSALALTNKDYDLIVSQPSHPWTAGASHLYTLEFLELARSRLANDGVFLQWINAQYVDEMLLRSLTATVNRVFENVRVYQPLPNVLLFLASDGSIDVEERILATGEPFRSYGAHYRRIGIGAVEDLVAAFTLDEKAVDRIALGAVPNSDDYNLLATHSRYKGDGFTAETLHEFLRELDVLAGGISRWPDLWNERIDFAYVTTQLVLARFERRAFELARSHPDAAMRHTMDGIGFNGFGQSKDAGRALARAVELDPDIAAASFLLVRPYLSVVGSADSPKRIERAVRRLPASAKTVLSAWKKGRAGDWAGIQALDAQLAAVAPTAQWYPVGIKLRVDWRLAAAHGSGNPQYATEALDLLDATLAFYWNFDLYVQRAAAAFIAGRAKEFVESVWWAARLVDSKIELAQGNGYQFSRGEHEVFSRRLAGLSRELERSLGLESHARAQSVRNYLDDVRKRLDPVGR